LTGVGLIGVVGLTGVIGLTGVVGLTGVGIAGDVVTGFLDGSSSR